MSDKPTIHEALAAVMEDVRAVRKADRNQQQGYAFRGIDAVVNAVGPALRKHGVIVAPVKVEANYRDVQTSTGKPSRECTVLTTFRFWGPAGDFIETMAPGESMDFGDKGAPKAMSVAFRIVLLQALCLPTDDVDPDSQSYERAGGEEMADPRAELQNRIVAAGADRGYAPAELVEDFASRTNGKDPRQGTEDELRAYLSWLEKQSTRESVPA